jgi:hypothetical protein
MAVIISLKIFLVSKNACQRYLRSVATSKMIPFFFFPLDPEHFIRCNREALECAYVSERLNHWIDLIFGHKQRGEEAWKSHNGTTSAFYFRGFLFGAKKNNNN